MSTVLPHAAPQAARDEVVATELGLGCASWLAQDAVWDPESDHAWSWCASDGSAYPYPEATAWVVWACARVRDCAVFALPADLYRRVDAAVTLLAELGHRGGLGRDGRAYTFDTAVAAAAVLAWTSDREAARPLLAALDQQLRARTAVQGGPALGQDTPATPWSHAVGAHALWACIPLVLAGRSHDARTWARTVVAHLADRPDAHCRHAATAYLHALAYGCAGLAVVGAEFVPVRERWLRVIAANLHTQGVSAWADGAGPRRADTTAQLATLAVGDLALPSHIARGSLRALRHFAAPEGGICYEPDSSHRNTWCTAMAMEAAATWLARNRWR